LEGRPPIIREGEKNVQNSAPFLTTFDFDREYIRNDSRYPKSERNVIDSDSSHVPWKKSRELRSTNKKVLLAIEFNHPSGFSGGDYISVLMGCCPLIFSYALEIDQVLLVHTKMGMRVPPQKKTFVRDNLKFCLKFSVLVPTSGLVGYPHNQTRDELWPTNKNVIARILTHLKCSFTVIS